VEERSCYVDRFQQFLLVNNVTDPRGQAEDESVADYLAQLHQLAGRCDFKDFLDQALRDRFVCGLKNAAMQKQLLAEVDLTINRAVEFALGMEMADKNAQVMQSASYGQPNVQAMGKERQSRLKKRGRASSMRCGGHHEASKCPFIDSECYKCQKKGYIARACRSSQSKTNEEEEKGKARGRRTNKVVDSSDREGIGCVNDVLGTIRDR